MFYRLRFFNVSTIRAILLAFQPTTEGVLDATSSAITSWFKDTILELQDAIWFAHEKLAKIFLLKTTAGRQYMLSYTKKRLDCAFPSFSLLSLTPKTSEGHRPRPRITSDQLQDLLPLSVSDVRGIWTSIQYVADYSHWDPLSRTPKMVSEALRRATYALLVRIIAHWVRGGKMNMELSISAAARLKDLQSTSNIADPPSWPKPPPRADRPCSTAEWVEYAATYTLATESPNYQHLIDRITDSPKYSTSNFNKAPKDSISDDGASDVMENTIENDHLASDSSSSLSSHLSLSSDRLPARAVAAALCKKPIILYPISNRIS